MVWRCPFCGLQYEKDDFYTICPGCGQRTSMVVRMVTEVFQPLITTHMDEVKSPFCFTINPAGSKKCRACGNRIDLEEDKRT